MPSSKEISAICITIEVEKESVLFILLTEDGTINRSGTGYEHNTENDLFIGITDKSLFFKLRELITDQMLTNMGGYDVPDKKGKNCKLNIALSFEGGHDNGFGFIYGSESQGPPKDICEIVEKAINITDPWYKKQKMMVKKSNKPWWKFW